jgi:hypothetical protein
MPEITKLVRANSNKNFKSLRSTIPMTIVNEWKLKPGSELEWQWRAIDNEMVMTVRKKK